jgi:hypothetical protein
MKTHAALFLIASALPFVAVANYPDKVATEKVKAICRAYEAGFFSAATDLAYGHRLTTPKGLGVLEPVEEVRAQRVHGEVRTYGYGSGIEDLAYQNGMLLYALCDAEEATGEAEFARLARRTFQGLLRMSTLSPEPGFVPRGPHPADGKSYYPDSSLDQHSLYVCGLWRYHRSRLSSSEEKEKIRPIVVAILRRFERNNWSFLVEDGSRPARAGGDMLPMRPTPAALLLAMLAIGHDLTGDPHWQELGRRFGEDDGGRRWKLLAGDDWRSPTTNFNNFINQDALRTETLRRLEPDSARRAILQRRIARTAEGMLTSSYFKQWKRSYLMSEPWYPEDPAIVNGYLKPTGFTIDTEIKVMQLWRHFDLSRISPPMAYGIRNHYEPMTLAVPAMVAQIALLSREPALVAQVRPFLSEMSAQVNFTRLDPGWPMNYAAVAALWNLGLPDAR